MSYSARKAFIYTPPDHVLRMRNKSIYAGATRSRLLCRVCWSLSFDKWRAEKDLPNMILAMADNLGWGDHRYANPRVSKATTPNLSDMTHSPPYILLQ